MVLNLNYNLLVSLNLSEIIFTKSALIIIETNKLFMNKLLFEMIAVTTAQLILRKLGWYDVYLKIGDCLTCPI